MRVSFGVPDGCPCDPRIYQGFYTWALYRGVEFICSGRPFSNWDAAYQAGVEFCQELPSCDTSTNDQN